MSGNNVAQYTDPTSKYNNRIKAMFSHEKHETPAFAGDTKRRG